MTTKIAICLLSSLAPLVFSGCVICCIEKTAEKTTEKSVTAPKMTPHSSIMTLSTNGTPPIEHHPQPPGESPGTGPCGTFCNYIFFNNSGAGYLAADSSFNVQITHGDGGPVIPNADYHLFWFRSSTSKGCASNTGSDGKVFTSVASRSYVFTVYFKPGTCSKYDDADIYLIPTP